MSGGEGRRAILVAIVSTVVFFTLVALAITHAPGWPEVRRTFFDWGQFKDSLPEISRAFLLNVKIFCIAEAFILVFALLLAVLRSLPGPLGLTHSQALRTVVLPQAVRRVIPPLLNDFIGLQKDTALVGFLGSVEAFKQSQIDAAATFNYTSYVAAALLFVALTIPLARFTDWLVLRDRRRRQ